MEPRIQSYAIIIGAMKSGTTSLFEYLAQHPEICPCASKEPRFFAFEEVWRKGLSFYEGLFEFDNRRHKWALEASTYYTKRPAIDGVIERMKQMPSAQFRFIYIMRHPLRRIELQIRWTAYWKHDDERLRLERNRTDWSLNGGISQHAVDLSRYAYQLEPYVDAFGRNSIYLTTLEQLQADPGSIISNILEFLGVFPYQVDTRKKLNTRDEIRTSRRLFDRMRGIRALKSAYQTFLPTNIRFKIWKALSIPASAYGRFTMTPQEEEAILRELKDDLSVLSEKYDIDVEGLWGIALGQAKTSLRLKPTAFTAP